MTDPLEQEFIRLRKEAMRARWRRRARMCVFVIVVWAWMGFCVIGALGVVGYDHPYLGGLLATAVSIVGGYLALREWGRWLDS